MPDPVCIFCAAEMPHEETDICADSSSNAPVSISHSVSTVLTETESIPKPQTSSEPRGVGAPEKEGTVMKDVLSTGRKRAFAAAPIAMGMVCEWALLKEAGGGITPIIGCPGNPASDRHHGPDKSVLNNEVGINLHRICDWCHSRWHYANDKSYEEPRPENGLPWLPVGNWKPHNPELKMKKMEALLHEAQRTKE